MEIDAVAVPDAMHDIDLLTARGGLYTFLGRCLEGEVDHDLLQALRGPLGGVIDALGIDLGEDVRHGPDSAVLETLAGEYTSLLVAPGAVSPFRSVFESGRLFQPQADVAAAAYRESGFVFRNIHSGEFADHIAVMLAFMGRLFEREAAAFGAGDAGSAAVWRERRARFLLRQLASWAIGWCRRARYCAQHTFYCAILEVVEQTVWDDAAAIGDAKTLKRLAVANRRPLARQKSDPEFRKASGL
jgi:TorA maturation chaperone TorD